MRATTIEGPNVLFQSCALLKFNVTDWQNTRNQITTGRRSKREWWNCVLCIPFILSPNECWLHTCHACVILTWTLGLRAPLVACNYGRSSKWRVKGFVIRKANQRIMHPSADLSQIRMTDEFLAKCFWCSAVMKYRIYVTWDVITPSDEQANC